MESTEAICVWLDTDGATWIVSSDKLDGKGQAITTKTLDTCETEEEAIESAKASAIESQLAVYLNPQNGPAECLYSAADAEMAAKLDSRGDMFTGSDVWDVAEDWVSEFDDADAAAEWMDAGFWDGATSAELRDAGWTAAEAKQFADEYDSTHGGDIIYAVCNGDVKIATFEKPE